MAKRSKGSGISGKQVIIALVLTIAVAYSVAITDVASRLVGSGRRVAELQEEVNAQKTQVVVLQTKVVEAQSPAQIERAAREELHAGRADEVIISSLPGTVTPQATAIPPTSTPRPTPKPTTSSSLPGRWQELLRLILQGLGR